MNRRGQVLVVVLLIIGVLLTVGLSIVSRSVTEVRTSTTQEESLRALEAAEAGAEQALSGIITAPSQTGTVGSANAKFEVTSGNVGSAAVYEIPFPLEAGDAVTVNLQGYNTTSNLRVCWANPAQSMSVELMLYYTDSGVSRVGRNLLNAGSSGNCGATSYGNTADVSFVSLGMAAGGQPQLLRIRAIGNGTAQPVAVQAQGGQNFPVQAREVTSIGTAGESVQRVRVTKSNPDFPAVFDSAIFSGNSLNN